MRWPMHAIRAPTRRQRASHVIAALQFIATTFVMHVMVGCSSGQIKMPRPDAYDGQAALSVRRVEPAVQPLRVVAAQCRGDVFPELLPQRLCANAPEQ